MNAEQIEEQLCRFHSLGIVVRNASSGLITALDQIGYQVPIAYEALVQALAERNDLSFQLWLDDSSTDVYGRFRRLTDGLIVQTYGLNGKTHLERLRIHAALWDTFGRNLTTSEALIVDLYNRTEQVDWDQAVVRRLAPDWPLPDLLALRQRKQGARGRQPALSEFRMMRYEPT
jgi:hypothetical protein